MEKVEVLEKRLINTELCLLRIFTIINRITPADVHEEIHCVIQEYFVTQKTLGFDNPPYFLGAEE